MEDVDTLLIRGSFYLWWNFVEFSLRVSLLYCNGILMKRHVDGKGFILRYKTPNITFLQVSINSSTEMTPSLFASILWNHRNFTIYSCFFIPNLKNWHASFMCVSWKAILLRGTEQCGGNSWLHDTNTKGRYCLWFHLKDTELPHLSPTDWRPYS